MPANRFDIGSTIATRRRLLDWLVEESIAPLERIAAGLTSTFRAGGTVYACGNGGSASQAEHFAAELVGRFKRERKSLAAHALSTNTAGITAIGNDYSFSEIFSRQLEGMGTKGDCLVALSTSGNSDNVINACRTAKALDMSVYALTGREGGRMAGECDLTLAIPDTDTARIQEMHLIALHLICQIVENNLISRETAGRAGA